MRRSRFSPVGSRSGSFSPPREAREVAPAVAPVAGTVVVVGTVVEANEAGASPLHAAPMAHIERIPRQMATLMSLQ